MHMILQHTIRTAIFRSIRTGKGSPPARAITDSACRWGQSLRASSSGTGLSGQGQTRPHNQQLRPTPTSPLGSQVLPNLRGRFPIPTYDLSGRLGSQDSGVLRVPHSSEGKAQMNQPNVPGVVEVKWTQDIIVKLGDVKYLLVHNKEVDLRNSDLNKDVLTPAFLYNVAPGDHLSKAVLEHYHNNFLQQDDIFQPAFLSNIIFYGCKESDLVIAADTEPLFRAWKLRSSVFVEKKALGSSVPSGPYIVGRGNIWQPWRVYEDFNNTLLLSFKPSKQPHMQLEELDSTVTSNQLRVVVPSRCYYPKTKELPLNGVRIVVKDIFDIRGFKTTICSKAWTELYPAPDKTASSIQKLIDQGAIIVAKAKLQAMIVREEPMECVEFLAPFNPRADGYQTANGSSNGSGAAVGSYEWVDFSICSDTNGSSRKPASWNGCFSIRPTHNSIPTDGVVSFYPRWDAPACYTRDISSLSEFVSHWYGTSDKLIDGSEMPTKILYPLDYLPTSNKDQTEVIDRFVEILEALCGIKRTNISLSKLWEKSLPAGPDHPNPSQYLSKAGAIPYYKATWKALAPFRDGYREKFDKEPFVHGALRWRWGVVSEVPQEECDALQERLDIYRIWLREKIMQVHNKNESVIVILPIEEGKPSYRDDPPPPFGLINGFSSLYMSPLTEGPEVTAPVGQISFTSRISNRTEKLPISVAILGAPGTDLTLTKLVASAFEKGGLPSKLATGSSIYTAVSPPLL